jgi:histone demethylase JARID1
MLFSSFCWHAEDLWMYSINYNHFGAPKTWYGVPGDYIKQVEKAIRDHVPGLFVDEPDLMLKLVTQIVPSALTASGVPVYGAVQNEREFIITFPRAYHAGFNQGFNCAEAVNFATDDWIRYGRAAVCEYARHRRVPVFALDQLIVGIASLKGASVDVLDDMRATVTSQRDWREYWRRHGITLWTALTVGRTAVAELCALCKQFCYLAHIRCSCKPRRVVCLRHIDDNVRLQHKYILIYEYGIRRARARL